jgi:hypothetical protein
MADRARRYERTRREQAGVTAIAREMTGAGRTAVALIARLAAATVVVEVEVHEYARPGLSDVLRDRFAATHRLTRVDQQRRDVPDMAPAAVSEFRPADLHWLVCRPGAAA